MINDNLFYWAFYQFGAIVLSIFVGWDWWLSLAPTIVMVAIFIISLLIYLWIYLRKTILKK